MTTQAFPPPLPPLPTKRHWSTARTIVVVSGATVAAAALVAALSVLGGPQSPATPQRPHADAATCQRLQALVDEGLSRNQAVERAVAQADVDEGTGAILRRMAWECF